MPSQLYAAEAVLPGHPDKLCDALADALVTEAVRRDPHARCAIDVALHGPTLYLTGRIAGADAASLDLSEAVRSILATKDVRVLDHLSRRAPTPDEIERRGTADDQAVLLGYAVDLPGTNDLPPEQWLAQRFARRLAALPGEAPNLRLGTDGKVIVLLEQSNDALRLAGCSVSLQQAADGPAQLLNKAVRATLDDELKNLMYAVPGFDGRLPEALAIRTFAAPAEAAGLSGRRLSMDLYGPRVGASGPLCGRDWHDPRRGGALLARRLAKAVVRTGAAHECRVTLTFLPGQHEAQLVSLTGDGRLLDASRWATLLDRSLAGVAARYTGKADLLELARRGHFARADLPWERLHFDEGPN